MEEILRTLAIHIAPVPCDGCPEDLFVVFKNISNVVLGVVGIIAVIMLVIGGIRYMVSGGDSKKITDAKNTVLYAIIGLVICLLSAVIVNTVIKVVPTDTGETTETSLVTESCRG